MAGVPPYSQWEPSARQQQPLTAPLPSLLSLRGTTTLPPLASSFGPSTYTSDSLIRPVLPRCDYKQPAASSWDPHPPPVAFALSSSAPVHRPADRNAWPDKRGDVYQQPSEPSSSSPLTWTRQVEYATEHVVAAASDPSERRPRVRSQRRREQCRTNQARYRMRQNRRLQRMESSASQLREEIALLLAYRARWSAHAPSERMAPMAMFIVEDYFRRFRSGVSGANIQLPLFTKAPSEASASPSSAATPKVAFNFKSESSSTCMKQAAFLRTVFLADADIGDGLFGPDAVLEQWWRYSCFFKRVHLVMYTISMGPPDDDAQRERVIATGRLTARVSSHALQRVFPHIDPESFEGSAMKDQILELPLRAWFEFVPQPGSFCRVASAMIDVDFLSELLRVIGSTDALQRVVAGALISPQGFIGELQDHPMGDNSSS